MPVLIARATDDWSYLPDLWQGLETENPPCGWYVDWHSVKILDINGL